MAEEQTQSLNLEVPKVEVDLQSELKEFNTTSLKCVDCQEKVVLPSADDIKKEKEQNSLLQGIEKFNFACLKHSETLEKLVLPSKEDIEQEKEAQNE